MKCTSNLISLTLSLGLLASTALASDVVPPRENYQAPKKEYSPYAGDHFPNQVLFGDTHLHTSWSADSGMAGGTLDQDDAYQVSRGEEVTSKLGWKVKLIRPLDFVVVADHAENLGLADFIQRSDPLVLANPVGKKWHDMVKSGNGYDAFLEWLRANNTDLINEPKMLSSAWDSVTSNADRYISPAHLPRCTPLSGPRTRTETTCTAL